MKEFKIINGKKIHPYVGGVKRKAKASARRASVVTSKFTPPYILSLVKDTFDIRDFTSQTNPLLFKADSNLSASSIIDYTSEMSPVKHQGNLGSCVAFAAAAMKEWQEKKEHNLEIKEGKRDHRKDKEND